MNRGETRQEAPVDNPAIFICILCIKYFSKSFKNSWISSLLTCRLKPVDGNTATEGPKQFTANWPPCRPWPSWPGSWGPACSSRGGAAGGAGGLHRWWCCAPGVGGQTCGRIHLLPQRQTYLFHLPRGWMRCHTPVQTHKDIDLYVLLGYIHNHRGVHFTVQTQTSLSWAISWVFTCPDTRLTRPNTWPVSNPQMVQVVSMLEVPTDRTHELVKERQSPTSISLRIYHVACFLPSRLGSTSFQSKEVRGAQKSEFLLLFSKHSRRVSVSLTCGINAK